MKKILLSFILQLFIIKFLIAQPYTVSGKVYYSPDGITQIGIENARVYSETPYVAETYTDASGNYTFSNVPSGTLMTIRAEKVGYTFTPALIERLVEKDYTNCNFVGSTANSTSIPVTFYYKATGSPVNVFLAGSMNAYNPSDPQYKLTNQGNGLFTITKELEPGDYVYKYVVDDNWVTDPYNPVTDGGQYNNSKLTVDDPMITYMLPAFNESYSTTNLPEIQAIVATNNTNLSITNYSLKINSNTILGTPVLTNNNKILTYQPLTGELLSGDNTCELSFTVDGKTVTKTVHFQYTSTGGSNGFSIGGSVKKNDNSGISGVSITLSSPVFGMHIGSTDANGNYSFTGLKASTYTITPSKSDYTFTPESITLDVDKDFDNQNFVATYTGTIAEKVVYSIRGSILSCGEPLEGATIESRGKTYITNASGEYTIIDTLVYNGTYYDPAHVNLSFSKLGYIFDYSETNIPSSYIADRINLTEENYNAKKATDNVTGKITFPDGSFANDISIKIVNEKTGLIVSNLVTDSEGKYSFPISYPVSPSEVTSFKIEPVFDMFTFEPMSISINNEQTCSNLKNKDFSVYVAPPSICMVSVSENGKNIVVWEKPAVDFITGYKIYRETNQANVFEILDTVAYNELSVFEDVASDPSVKAYRYKIGAITNFSGYETELSDLHKTIHLTINKGTGNAWNLIWSHYEGLAISTYKLYRGTSKDNMTFLADIAGNLISYTDNTAPVGDMYYQIEMVLEDACNPEVAKPLLKSAKAGNIYASTKSNVVNSANASTDINKLIEDKNLIYPNPVENTLYFKNSKALNEFQIYTIQGTIIKQGVLNTSIDVSDIQSGIYLIRVKNDEKWESFRFIKR
ncbi:MAG TPA: T9SS type A sorting domain-containing protein [Bacteroidales bacterium]|nr:T9SS type A sorting domain-containing protein [Bacteroidales bacterium]HPO65422.1 T9SS type A sorting domain-containing protein [Bacteroidales bacterium]